MKILFVGDSITVGLVGYPSQDDGTSFRGPFLRRNSSYQGVGPFTDKGGFKHGGVGGASTNTFLTGNAQWVSAPTDDATWMRVYQPDVVHVMLGTNDLISYPSNPNIPAIVDRMAQLCNSAAALVPSCKIYVASIPEGGPAWFSINALAYNAKLREQASHAPSSKFPGNVSFVDTCALINQAFWKDTSATPTKALYVDGTHPNGKGYDLMAQGLQNALAAKGSSVSLGARVLAGGLLAYGAYKLSRWI